MVPTQPDARTRPPVVSAAAAVLLVTALAALAATVALLVAAARFRGRYLPLARRTDATDHDINDVGDTIRATMGVLAVLLFLLAVALVLLAVGVLRHSFVARILTWVAAGLGLLCACSQVSGAASAVSDMTYTGDPERVDVASQLTTAVQDALPAWFPGLLGAAATVQLLGYILVAVLLALPPANRYFRRARPAPVPGGTPWPAP
ncbi:MAG TPA: hypothetical protein VHA75_17885, partial [Rugosimonospora sp.]|nr:hypothetical protein [Rugosimonospora sp.]